MTLLYPLMDSVKEFITNSKLTEIEIGCSNSQVIKIEKKNKIYYLKIAKKGALRKEWEALKWIDGKLKVPKVILYDENEEEEYLITESLKGEMICSNSLLNTPDIALKIIVEAFHHLQDVNISDCPFDRSIHYRLKCIENNINNKWICYDNLPERIKNRFSSLEEILNYLKDNYFDEEFTFSHGDPSLPNIFANQLSFSGFIDVGECGKADKWFDLAITEKSIIRNLGIEYVDKFYQELNIIPDRKKIDYYNLMLELLI